MRIHAPGRVTLIGEHTDYNDGLVLPMAVEMTVWVEGSLRGDAAFRVRSRLFEESCRFDLDHLDEPEELPWVNYVKGVLGRLRQWGYQLPGASLEIGGDLPVAAGMSSSAALEVAVCLAMGQLCGVAIPDEDVVRICHEAENLFVGVHCGIMDQFVSALGRRDHALLLDCRTLEVGYVPLELGEHALVVVDSAVRRELSGSDYNRRRRECEQAVRELNGAGVEIESLRDLSPEALTRHHDRLSQPLERRCAHVVTENQRVRDAVEALRVEDFEEFGRLLFASHESLRDQFEVSTTEIDVLVDVSREFPGVLGARIIGAGFGGCALCLVRRDRAAAWQRHLDQVYRLETGLQPAFYPCAPSDGALRRDRRE